MENKIKEIVLKTRQTGNTSWILNSAINNPNCVIVSKTMNIAKCNEKDYDRLLSQIKKPWYVIILEKFLRTKSSTVKKPRPRFVSIDSEFRGLKIPVIFDNSSFV